MSLNHRLDQIIRASFYALTIIVPLILTPVNYELFEFNKILAVYFFTLVIAAAWVSKMILARRLIFRRTPFDIPILLFFLSQLVSTVFSIDRHTSLWGYYSRFNGGLVSTASYLTLYYAYISNLASPRFTKKFLKVTLTTALIVSLYGILEHFGIDEHVWIQDVKNRVFSTLGQPNWLAAYLLTLIPVALAFFLKARTKLQITVYGLLITAFYLTLLYTKSRSGLAGLAVAYSVFWILILFKQKIKSFPWKKFLLTSAALALIAGLVGTDLTPTFKEFLRSRSGVEVSPPEVARSDSSGGGNEIAPPAITLGGSSSQEIRNVVWQGALDVWRAYPWFGSGVETFAYSYYNFKPQAHNLLSEWDFLYNKAHNEYLNFLATTGIFGLGSYLLLQIWFTIWCLKSLKIENWELKIALLAGFIGLSVSNFFGFAVVPVSLFFFLWPALAFSLTSPQTDQATQPSALNNQQSLFLTAAWLTAAYFAFGLVTMWRADVAFNTGKNLVAADQILNGFLTLKQSVDSQPDEPLFRSEYAEAAAKLAVLYHQQTLTDSDPVLATQAATVRDQMVKEAVSQIDVVNQQNQVHLNYWKSRIQIFLLLSTIDENYRGQALSAFETTLRLSPTDAKLYYNLGLLYVQMGQNGLAQQILEKTIDLKPNYEAARFALGSLYQDAGQLDLARVQYQYILDYLNPANQTVKDKLEEL